MEEIQDKAAEIADKLSDSVIFPILARMRDVKKGTYTKGMYSADIADIMLHINELEKEGKKLVRELYDDVAVQNFLFAEKNIGLAMLFAQPARYEIIFNRYYYFVNRLYM